jgi:antitoxin HicB
MYYPVTLERDDNDTILVSLPDFPEAHTFGDTEEEALTHAQAALATVIDAYIKDRRDIPLPSAIVTSHRVAMPALVEAKVRLYETMRAKRVRKAELARRLEWHMPQVDRLLEMTHASKLEQLEAAFNALGKRLVVSVQDIDVPAVSRPIARQKRAHRMAARPRPQTGGSVKRRGRGRRVHR